jgi:transcriptional regulator with XRE-family HTH domain
MAVSIIHAPDPELIREWLRSAIAKSGLSASALAKKAGVAQTTVTRFLRHNVKYVPSWGTLVQIADAAGVDPPQPLKLSRHLSTIVSKFDATSGATVFTSTRADEQAAPRREEYFDYLLGLRKEVAELYARLMAGKGKYPELGDISDPWAAIVKLDRWLTTRVEKYAEPTADLSMEEFELRNWEREDPPKQIESENASTAIPRVGS